MIGRNRFNQVVGYRRSSDHRGNDMSGVMVARLGSLPNTSVPAIGAAMFEPPRRHDPAVWAGQSCTLALFYQLSSVQEVWCGAGPPVDGITAAVVQRRSVDALRASL